MGTVYLAQRSDGHFEQTAAIKVLRGIPSAAALDRLARERQILARLSHPHIARLLDGGATPQGQPFLVMEYIDGEPIDRFCARGKLSVAGVLGLLVTVCDAVTHAHAQLIIHCDLKPSNLLVGASGHVWLVDFGIARLLDLDDSRAPQSPVSQGAHGFTPRFSSPEQEAGEHVTTASDVFSLGRLMQELLAHGSRRALWFRRRAEARYRALPGDRAGAGHAAVVRLPNAQAAAPTLAGCSRSRSVRGCHRGVHRATGGGPRSRADRRTAGDRRTRPRHPGGRGCAPDQLVSRVGV
jgi:serine/threonine protein kinase